MSILCRFRALLEGMAAFCPIGSALKVMALRPRLLRVCVTIPSIDVGKIFRDECIRLGASSFSAPGALWSPEAAPPASDIGPSPLQGAPAGDLFLLSSLTLRKSSLACRRPYTQYATQRKRERGPRGPAEPRRCIGTSDPLYPASYVPDTYRI